jgi:RND family efflux transporter MFP subunit
MLGYTQIHAPFDGVVVSRKADPGTLATPGTPLLLVDKVGRLQLEVTVDESLLGTVKMGANVPVVIDALAQEGGAGRITGKVSRIVPAADATSHSFVVKLDLPASAHLRSGMYGRAELSRGSKSALMVPRSAVITRGSLQEVYVVGPDQIASLRYVTLGVPQGDLVEVLSGLSAGEMIVDAPGSQELGGKRIEVQR